MIILGQAGIKFIGTRTRLVPGSGITTVFQYVADSPGDADSFGASQYQAGNQVDVDNTSPPYRIEVSSPTSSGGTSDEDYVDRWEILPVENDKSIFEFAKYASIADTTNGNYAQSVLKDFQKNPEDGSAEATSGYVVAYNKLDNAGATANAYSVLDLLRRGTDHYQVAASAVRWTRTIGDGYTGIGGAFDSANKIWTSAQVISLDPPPLYASAINASFANGPEAATGYTRGWLKKQPSITQRGNGRSDLVQEWTLENWSNFLYGLA